MKLARFVLILLLPFSLASCVGPANVPPAVPPPSATQQAEAARAAERAAQQRINELVAANADALMLELSSLIVFPDGIRAATITLKLIRTLVPTPPPAADLERARKRIQDTKAGLPTAPAAEVASQKEATDVSAVLVKSALDSREAEARERSARQEAERALEHERQENARKLAELTDADAKKQRWFLFISGGVCLALAGVILWLSQFKALMGAGVFAALGLFAFGLAQLVAQPWFKYVFGGIPIVGLIIGIIVVARMVFKDKKAKDETQKLSLEAKSLEAAKSFVEGSYRKTIDTLDEAYDNGKVKLAKLVEDGKLETVQDVLDAFVFDKASNGPTALSADQKLLVHSLRAKPTDSP